MSERPTRPDRLSLAVGDLGRGLASIHVWPLLAWQEIRQRYRRSTLGPFWLTISTGALIGGMAPLYGRLFGQELESYFPYLAVGIIVWQLIASLINESGYVFITGEEYIKQVRMPFTIHVLRMIWRNAIIFAHNFVVVVLVLIAFLPDWSWLCLLALPGLALLLVNAVWLGLLLGMVCARFRDIPPIVGSLVQVAFFLTPVMWKSEMLGRYQWAADVNPLHHFIEVIRAPLLGQPPSVLSWSAVAAMTVAGFTITMTIFARYRARIAYWV